MSETERKIVRLPSVEIPGPEKVTIICEFAKSLFVVVQHNSIYGDSPGEICQGPVVVDIPKGYKGTITSSCGTCAGQVEVNTTHVLLTTKRLIFCPSDLEKPISITPEAIQKLSSCYRLPTPVLEAWGKALNNDLNRLEGYLKSQHGHRISQDQPEEPVLPKQ